MTPSDRPVILVVEDEPDSREALCTLLRDRGYLIDEARNGNEALALARRRPPDFVLLDLGLPDLGGTYVSRELRRCCGRNAIIVALTGKSHGDVVDAGDVGIDHVITKPFVIDNLLELLPRV